MSLDIGIQCVLIGIRIPFLNLVRIQIDTNLATFSGQTNGSNSHPHLPHLNVILYDLELVCRVAGAGRSRGFWPEPEPKFSPGSGSG